VEGPSLPGQITTPPANTNSNEDEEPVSISNNGSAVSPRSRPRSPWTTDKSSDSEAHGYTESSRSASIKEKAVIQYPVTPESSLVCAKEEPPRLDTSMAGFDGLPKDIVSRTLPHVHAWVLIPVYSMYGADHLVTTTLCQWQNWGARASGWALIWHSAGPSGLGSTRA